MQDVDLDLLRCFKTVAELRNFTAAGMRLGRSQSAVSIRIKKLEELVGTQVLIRNNQNVQLTARGEALLRMAERLLGESERLMAEMQGPRVSGRLRIGLLEYVAPHHLPEIMASLQRKLPGADLQFHVGLSASLRTALQKGEIDIALALHDGSHDASSIIAEDQLVWVEGATRRPASAVENLDLCLLQPPCLYREAAFKALRAFDQKHREIVTGNSVQSVRQAVQSGLGVGVLGASCLGDGLRVFEALQERAPLPRLKLSLHGTDPRKADIEIVVQDVLSTHMHGGR